MLGIDSCPIEGMNYDAVNELLASAGLFDPEEFGVSVAVTFGYRAREIARRAAAPSRTWSPGPRFCRAVSSGYRVGRLR